MRKSNFQPEHQKNSEMRRQDILQGPVLNKLFEDTCMGWKKRVGRQWASQGRT